MSPLPVPVAFLLSAEGAETFLGLPTVVWKTANLLLFFGLMWWLLKKPLASFFGERRAEVAKALSKAEEDRRRAETMAAELNARLAQIETELANLKAAARRDAEAEHAALLTQAEEESARIVSRTKGEIESRVRYARAELTGYAGDLALELARDLLASRMTPEDQKRLVADGVSALSKAKA
ncbi:MAG TPA: ATP synthase F0 subunit B [Thermoanaerobaculia bacterium]|nr:ATP synthase F0 subunit B [Thermoanaerobaculia bacterium]